MMMGGLNSDEQRGGCGVRTIDGGRGGQAADEGRAAVVLRGCCKDDSGAADIYICSRR